MKSKADKNNKEIRIANIKDFTVRSAEESDDGKMILEGYAAVTERETMIGDKSWGWLETIDRHAFDEADLSDVPMKYNHENTYPILARTRNKSLTLKVDDKGLFIRAELIDTSENVDMYKRIKAGLIDKMSFAFTVPEGGEEVDRNSKPPRVRIKKIDRVWDVSVVDIPAYDDTSIYARSLERLESIPKPLENEKRASKVKDLIIMYKGEE